MDIELYLKIGNDKAFGIYNGTELIVKAGSTISSKPMASSFKQAKSRTELIQKHAINDNGKIILSEDLPFKSPSAAANFCTGSSSNGLILWKTKDGIDLASFLRHLDED